MSPREGASRRPTLRRCRVVASVCAPAYEYGRTFAPGALVDLEERVADGVTLRDLVRDEWFDPPAADAQHEVSPAPPVIAPMDRPVEEQDDGIADRA